MPTITQIFETLCDRRGELTEEMIQIDREISALHDSRAQLASGHAHLSFAITQIEPLIAGPDFAEVGAAAGQGERTTAAAMEVAAHEARRNVRQLVRDWLDDGRRRNGGTVMEIAQALQIMPRGVEKALAYWSQPSKAIVTERGGRWYSAQRVGAEAGNAPTGATEVAQEPSGAPAPLSGTLTGIPDLAKPSLPEGEGLITAEESVIPTGGQIDEDDLGRLHSLLGAGAALTALQLLGRGVTQGAIDDAIDAGILTYRQAGDWVLYELAAPVETARAAE